MKFSEMPYVRPDLEKAKAELAQLTQELENAETYQQARELLMRKDKLENSVMTHQSLAYVRHSIDTRDEFYKQEHMFWDAALPELQEYLQKWTAALLASKHRSDFEKEFGSIIFINAELDIKAFSPEIIPEMQEENDLVRQYENLIASAQIDFEGGTYTISQMAPFKTSADDEKRLAAWKAEGQWYKDNQSQLDELYDKLVHLRDTMGKKLGYGGYTALGYYRMGRNCYTKEDVEQFRAAVRTYLVPVADSIFREKAARFGKPYPMSFADNAIMFRSGDAKPVGNADDILQAARRFYEALSPETGRFFNLMLDNELLDVLSTEGKQGGGYCTELIDYEVLVIFANFNGTSDDVETLVHEGGHAFAGWKNVHRVPTDTIWPSMEGCEVHSMSMEFFSWPWAKLFYGDDSRKFYYGHLAGALTFIPYGTMVDHFQHEVFAHPDWTPRERHDCWKKLLGIYMPWQKLDGDIPFYAEGEGWQRQHHIYSLPFYYIDYCLAQTVALQFWAMIQKDKDDAWKHYMAYTEQGGSRVFTELLTNAGLRSPFDEACLRGVCTEAKQWLSAFDLTGIS